jgi:hypothetical protein
MQNTPTVPASQNTSSRRRFRVGARSRRSFSAMSASMAESARSNHSRQNSASEATEAPVNRQASQTYISRSMIP